MLWDRLPAFTFSSQEVLCVLLTVDHLSQAIKFNLQIFSRMGYMPLDRSHPLSRRGLNLLESSPKFIYRVALYTQPEAWRIDTGATETPTRIKGPRSKWDRGSFLYSIVVGMSSTSASSSAATTTASSGGEGSGSNNPTSSPLLFFVALGFGVVFTNLWYVAPWSLCPGPQASLPVFQGWHLTVVAGSSLESSTAFDIANETVSSAVRKRESP